MTPEEHDREHAREVWVGERPYSIHLEPPEQSGEAYARCKGCGREIIPVGRFAQLSHPADCPVQARMSKASASDGGTER